MTLFRRKKKESPKPTEPPKEDFDIVDSDRLDYFLGKAAVGREAIDKILMADERWVRRKRIEWAIQTVGQQYYTFFTDESVAKLQRARALLATLADEKA